MANTVAIPPPPRLTGNSQDDLTVLVNFLWEWYRAIVQQGAFVQNTDIGGSVQPQDATLTALADLPTAADLLPYFTGQDVAALTAFTAYARTLIAAATAGSARTTLGLGSLATKNSIATGDIDNDAVTNDKLAQMATMTVKGNDTAGTADPQDLTATEVWTLLGAAPTLNIGNVAGGNYAEFEADGTLELHGTATAWRDELGDITRIKSTGAGISEDTAENTMVFATTCNPTNDYLYANVQLNHDRLLGAVISPHVHWFQDQNNAPNFLLQYRWQINGQAKVTAWTNYPMTTLAFTYTAGTLNQVSSGAGITPPANTDVSDILQIRLTRDKTNTTGAFAGSDTHTASVHATSFDVHIELDTIGSRTAFTK